jgi:phospholipase C
MDGFNPDSLPVFNWLASEFAIFDRFFSSVPGPTWPNRMFALTGTSMGNTDVSVWMNNIQGKFFPQKTLYQQLDESGYTWKNYYNDTPWELMLEYVVEHPGNVQSLDSFFYDCENSQLPSFSWINPRSGMNITTGIGSNDFHPTHDVNSAEEYMKTIYEALRASPQWEKTLFLITFDEHGGFYDHVVPPDQNIPTPGDNTPPSPVNFTFDRLGIRIPTLAISPWINKGTVISAPREQSKVRSTI